MKACGLRNVSLLGIRSVGRLSFAQSPLRSVCTHSESTSPSMSSHLKLGMHTKAFRATATVQPCSEMAWIHCCPLLAHKVYCLLHTQCFLSLLNLNHQTRISYGTTCSSFSHAQMCIFRITSIPTTLSPHSIRRMTGVHRRPRCYQSEPARCQAAAQTQSVSGINAAATTAAFTPAWNLSSLPQVSRKAMLKW